MNWLMILCMVGYLIIGLILGLGYLTFSWEWKDIMMICSYLLGLVQGYWVARTLKPKEEKRIK